MGSGACSQGGRAGRVFFSSLELIAVFLCCRFVVSAVSWNLLGSRCCGLGAGITSLGLPPEGRECQLMAPALKGKFGS